MTNDKVKGERLQFDPATGRKDDRRDGAECSRVGSIGIMRITFCAVAWRAKRCFSDFAVIIINDGNFSYIRDKEN